MKNFIKDFLEHRRYIKIQKDRSLSKYKGSFENEGEKRRKHYLTELIKEYSGDTTEGSSALVIGCRNPVELDLLEQIGFEEVVGIDLFSFDKRVKVMDMHNLKFEDNAFDLVLMSHSLEHAADFNKVIGEVSRVSKSTGLFVVEVPVNFEVKGADLHDFSNSENLFKIIQSINPGAEVLFKEDLKNGDSNNFTKTDVVRIIVRLSK